jgi:hypothetical protein
MSNRYPIRFEVLNRFPNPQAPPQLCPVLPCDGWCDCNWLTLDSRKRMDFSIGRSLERLALWSGLVPRACCLLANGAEDRH